MAASWGSGFSNFGLRLCILLLFFCSVRGDLLWGGGFEVKGSDSVLVLVGQRGANPAKP